MSDQDEGLEIADVAGTFRTPQGHRQSARWTEGNSAPLADSEKHGDQSRGIGSFTPTPVTPATTTETIEGTRSSTLGGDDSRVFGILLPDKCPQSAGCNIEKFPGVEASGHAVSCGRSGGKGSLECREQRAEATLSGVQSSGMFTVVTPRSLMKNSHARQARFFSSLEPPEDVARCIFAKFDDMCDIRSAMLVSKSWSSLVISSVTCLDLSLHPFLSLRALCSTLESMPQLRFVSLPEWLPPDDRDGDGFVRALARSCRQLTELRADVSDPFAETPFSISAAALKELLWRCNDLTKLTLGSCDPCGLQDSFRCRPGPALWPQARSGRLEQEVCQKGSASVGGAGSEVVVNQGKEAPASDEACFQDGLYEPRAVIRHLDLHHCCLPSPVDITPEHLASLGHLALRGCMFPNHFSGAVTATFSIACQARGLTSLVIDHELGYIGWDEAYPTSDVKVQVLAHFSALASLRELRHLSLARIHLLDQLPESFALSLTALRSLSMRTLYQFCDLSSVCQMTRLSSLVVCNLPIFQLPSAMSRLTELEELTITECDGIDYIPEWLGELSNLTTLNLRDLNNITCLPHGLGQLKRLRELYLGLCFRVELPQSFTALTTLQVLDIVNCSMEGVHELLAALPDLRVYEKTGDWEHAGPEKKGNKGDLEEQLGTGSELEGHAEGDIESSNLFHMQQDSGEVAIIEEGHGADKILHEAVPQGSCGDDKGMRTVCAKNSSHDGLDDGESLATPVSAGSATVDPRPQGVTPALSPALGCSAGCISAARVTCESRTGTLADLQAAPDSVPQANSPTSSPDASLETAARTVRGRKGRRLVLGSRTRYSKRQKQLKRSPLKKTSGFP